MFLQRNLEVLVLSGYILSVLVTETERISVIMMNEKTEMESQGVRGNDCLSARGQRLQAHLHLTRGDLGGGLIYQPLCQCQSWLPMNKRARH